MMVWEYHSKAHSRDQKVDRIVANYQSKLDAKAKAREEAKNYQHGYDVGDIFYSSWGYNQTNVDYYQVTKLVGKKMLEVQMIGNKVVRSNRGGDYVAPDTNNKSGERPIRVKVNTNGNIKVRNHTNAYPWDGKPHLQSSAYGGH